MDDVIGQAQPVAWTAITEHEPVYSSDSQLIGSVAEVLGSDDGGIFHGLVVRHHRLEHSLSVPASQVDSITLDRVTLSISAQEFEHLPGYEEEASYHLGIKGLFRHRPAWIRDRD